MSNLLPFSYQIKRSKRKSLAIHIRNAAVEVRAPEQLPVVAITQFLQKKSHWVQSQLQEQQQKLEEKPQIQHQGQLLFMGKTLQLDIIRGKPAIYQETDRLSIACEDESQAQTVLEQWLQCEAEGYLSQRTLELAQIMGENERISDIRFRKTRSKWGHCTSKGVLQFNWLIIMASPEIIDYLIIHELSHLQHMNHSALFWQRVAIFCPDYAERRQWLRKNGHKLWE